jgi:membrane protein DedA with SNARE-associated domain
VNGSTAALLVLFVVALVPLLPTEVTLLGMGVAAAQHEISLLSVIVVAVVGCVLSDQSLYAVGRFGGLHVLTRMRERPGIDAAVSWVDGHLRQHPRPVLVVVRWLPSGGTVGALLAGSLRLPMAAFLAASVIGVTLWTSYVAMLGYLGGRIVQQPDISLLVSLGVATLLGAAITFALKRHQHGPASVAR